MSGTRPRTHIGLVPSDIAPFVRYGTPVSVPIESATDECVELLRDLIRIPSVNPPGIREDAGRLGRIGTATSERGGDEGAR